MIKHTCPECKKEIEKIIETKDGDTRTRHIYYPIKDKEGNFIWKNLFRIDFVSLMYMIAFIFIFIGVAQINDQCYDIVESPCTWAKDAGCNFYQMDFNNSNGVVYKLDMPQDGSG